MQIPVSWLFGVAFVGCVLATICDMTTRRIPNLLTIGLMVIALGFSLAQGFDPFARSVGALSLVFILGTLAHARGWMGGGDVKLAAAVAAALGFPDTIAFMLYASLSGGVIALIVLALRHRGKVRTRLHVVLANLTLGIVPSIGPGSRKMPYAVAITCGFVLAYASRTFFPLLRPA